jgi:hypothetical protein
MAPHLGHSIPGSSIKGIRFLKVMRQFPQVISHLGPTPQSWVMLDVNPLALIGSTVFILLLSLAY